MKIKIILTTFCLLFLLNSTTLVNAEVANKLFSSNTVSFKGVDKKWEILYRMSLIGTEIKYETIIKYKGNYDTSLVTSNFHYLITDKHLGTIGEGFSLDKSGEFHGKKRECGGCKFQNREKEVFCEIYWKDKKDRVVLKRVDTQIN